MARIGIGVGCFLLALLDPTTGSAASYRFVVLADSATEVKPTWDKAPSIDDSGAVAFLASNFVFGGTYRLLIATQPGATTFDEYVQVDTAIGVTPGSEQIGTFANGKLAYLDYLDASPTTSTIHRYEGLAPVPVQVVSGTPVSDAPAMNGFGAIAFLQDLPRSVVVTDGEDAAVVASLDTVFADGTDIDNLIRPAPDIDGVGRVAYFASIASEDPICDDRILLSGTNPPLVLARSGSFASCPVRFLDVAIPLASNDSGSVAFSGEFSAPGGTVDAVFVDETVVWEARTPGFEEPSINPVKAVALNDEGTVAFLLEFAGPLGRSLYVGPDPVEDRVIGRGDALCGGIVRDIEFHRFGLNDAGELALGLRLADDRRLIVRAEPTLTQPGACVTEVVPEPTTLGWGALAALFAVVRCRRCSRARAGALRRGPESGRSTARAESASSTTLPAYSTGSDRSVPSAYTVTCS